MSDGATASHQTVRWRPRRGPNDAENRRSWRTVRRRDRGGAHRRGSGRWRNGALLSPSGRRGRRTRCRGRDAPMP
ncbi:hypothetical protein DNK48_00700 [Streptomyces malaysiensis subsp. malaysiensis]|nr:hypothetical protein DNK48_00700 [Streptomyces malaysiensis]